MRPVCLIALLLAATASASDAALGSKIGEAAQPNTRNNIHAHEAEVRIASVSSLLDATRLSARSIMEVTSEKALADREDSSKSAQTGVNLDKTPDSRRFSKTDDAQNRGDKKKRTSSAGHVKPSLAPMVSPTGGDNLLLDFIRFSSYEHVIRSDGVMISNTTGPSVSLSIGGVSTRVHVPHLVQVWAVRPAQEVGGADDAWLTSTGHGGERGKITTPKWHLSPDALTTHYFAIEHEAITSEREAITGVLSSESLASSVQSDSGQDPSRKGGRPFTVSGRVHPAPPSNELSMDNPAWMSAFTTLREGPVGSFIGSVSTYIQTNLLEVEEAVKRFWYGGVVAAHDKPRTRQPISSSPSLGIEGARLVSLNPVTPVDGSFHVELTIKAPHSAAVSAPSIVSLKGNYSFSPSRGFLANPKIDGPAAFSAHTYFDYSLTFVSSGPIDQTVMTEGASSRDGVPRCTHYRAVAQHDKRHIVLTTFWEYAAVGKEGEEGRAPTLTRFERSVTLSLQEVAGEDMRFSADLGAMDDIEDEDRSRFRFLDATTTLDSHSVLKSSRTPNSVAALSVAVERHDPSSLSAPSQKSESELFFQPLLRRVSLGSYYVGEDGKTFLERDDGEGGSLKSTFKRYVPISGRLKKLLPTIALLLIVTLVKFGPKFYLTWLDAKQQRQKGAISMKTAIETNLKTELIRSKTAQSPAALAAKAKALKEAEAKEYGSGKQLAKAEAILKAHMVKNPRWRKGYEEAMERRKQMSPEELADLKAQELALLEQMKREDGLL